MKNILYCVDNLEALKSIRSNSVDLIYIDLPFSLINKLNDRKYKNYAII
jgi:DNA modification methylase